MTWMAPEIIINKSSLLGKVDIYAWEMQIRSFLAE